MSTCAACGKGGDGLKTCTACKEVKYCSVSCQKVHRPKHKKACKFRAAQLEDEATICDAPPAAAAASEKRDRYDGEMKDYRPHGEGAMIFANGDFFVGEWEDGSMHRGRMTYAADGSCFEGMWTDNKPINHENGRDAETPQPVASSMNVKLEETDDENEGMRAVPPSKSPSIWALILSKYCAYEDVRNCLAVNKSSWKNVPPLMDRLYVFKASELHVGYASRFENVKHAYVYSLTSITSTDEEDIIDINDRPIPKTSLSLDTARDVVPFLESFPKLEVVFLGGYTPGFQYTQMIKPHDRTRVDLPYTYVNCSTEGHQDVFRGMLREICGAFKGGSLDASTLHIGGIFDSEMCWQMECASISGPGEWDPCDICPQVCQTFPLSVISDRAKFGRYNICTKDQERLKTIFQRDENFLRKSGILTTELLNCGYGTVRVTLPPKVTRTRVTLRETFRMTVQVAESTFETIEFLCKSCGCDPSIENMQTFATVYHPFAKMLNLQNVCEFEGNRNYISRESFDRLVGLGFQVHESEFIIIVPCPGNDYWSLDPCEEEKWAGRSEVYDVVV